MPRVRYNTHGYQRAAIVAALAGLVAAGCGSSHSSSSGSTSGPKSTATGSPILIGGQGDVSSNVGVADGFEARIAAANAAGGIDGRPIKFAGMLDDSLSAQTNLTNSQKLVESNHVVAVAPYISEVCTSSGTGFLERNKTPFIGYATCGGWIGNHWGIGINGAQDNYHLQGIGGFLQVIKATEHMPSMHVTKPSDVKIAVIGFNTAAGAFATETLSAAAKAAGMHVVYAKAPIPATTTNFAPYAQDVIGSGANVAYEITDAPLSVGLSAALKAANFKGFVFNGVTYLPGQLASNPSEEAALNGVGVASEFPVNQDDIPAVKTEEQQLAADGKPANLTTGISIGYWSGDVLVQLLKATAARAGASNITGAAMEATAAAGWTYTGGLGTMTYPAAWTYPTGCSTLVQEEGTGYKLLEPYTCTPKYAKTGL
jgi:ABC-type branched-subunit amino acid transport system substrate-binding protein